MAQDSVERLLGRLITDDAFRKALKKDFNKACYLNGLIVSESEKALIRQLNFDAFSQLAANIDDGIRRECRQ
ncbi:MAG: Os1348 family NHLP clan protein [Desulfobacteraceae bacterium]|jgi:predicted restriction endonuclease|nr:Os1348 family NHLP clan protein [Desulfobacteraceae bacterium]